MMTELERSSLAAPNASYDSAIDSLDEYYCDLASPSSVSLCRSSLVGGTVGHLALSPSAASPAPPPPYQSKPFNKISPANGPILFSANGSKPTHQHQQQHSVQSVTSNVTPSYRSLADYHRLYMPRDRVRPPQIEQVSASRSPQQSALHEATTKTMSGKMNTRMAMLLNQIDASSVALFPSGQTRQPDSSPTRTVGTHSSRRGATSKGSPVSESELLSCSSGGLTGAPQQVRHSGQSSQRVCCTDTPTANSSLSASSPLRSSRSFTTSYRQRPNVTLIRRKSASERLAESRGKYIRSDLDVADSLPEGFALDVSECCAQDEDRPHHLAMATRLRTTPTSTKSSHTSSSRLSPISDQIALGEEKCSSGTHSHPNLADKIHCHLNKSKYLSSTPHSESGPKKRVSPKNSDGSMVSGMSNLEIQLRELISLDTTQHEAIGAGNESRLRAQCLHRQPDSPAVEPSSESQKQREAANIYRAELKFIGSSSSSLSSMYSEPNLSPVENHLSSCNDTLPVAPSLELQDKLQLSNVVRSKSDVSPHKTEPDKLRSRYRTQVERLFGTLGLDSDLYHPAGETDKLAAGNRKSSQSSNIQNYTASSVSNESLHKIATIDAADGGPCQRILPRADKCLSGAKSSSSNELSSLNSSQLSVGEHLLKSALNHSKSTSKLTIENLMLHQRSLTSSRSCHNLAASLHTGPSVVERNARIIKWLFNCRKAMTTQTTTVDS